MVYKLKQVLGAIFEVVVDDYPELANPTRKVVLSHYVAKKGSALSKEEEKPSTEGNTGSTE